MSDKIIKIIADALHIQESAISDSLGMTTTPEWDSLKHMDIIVGLEQELGIELSFDEIAEMRNVGEIRRILSTRQEY